MRGPAEVVPAEAGRSMTSKQWTKPQECDGAGPPAAEWGWRAPHPQKQGRTEAHGVCRRRPGTRAESVARLLGLLHGIDVPLPGGMSPNFLEEFDPGSERTLAAWLRHASRTDRSSNIAVSGERVSNAWVTYPELGDNSGRKPFAKVLLIPDEVAWSHDRATKGGDRKTCRFGSDPCPIS